MAQPVQQTHARTALRAAQADGGFGTPASALEREAANAGQPHETARPDDPLITFAYACLRNEFASLLAQRPNPDETPTAAAVHKLRIATRRLRVALRMFRRMLPKHEAQQLRKDLRWLSRALGEVRDLDVYTENFRTYRQAVSADRRRDLDEYELHLRRARADARNELGALFTHERYARLIVSFSAFLDGAPSEAAERRWQALRVSDGPKKYLRKSAKRVRKLGRKVVRKEHAEPTPKTLHRLRIRAKRLRYELELFVEALPALERAAKATKALQQLLGEHQDACTATARLEKYAAKLRTRDRDQDREPAALGELLAIQQRKAEETRAAFVTEWRKFAKIIERGKLAA